MITINGYFNGTDWDSSSRTFKIKTLGTKESGAILCGLNVSGKDKDGNKQYGKSVDVKINIKSEAEGSRVYGLIASGDSMLQMNGFFVPNNWTKEGKEMKGNQFLVTDSTTVKQFSANSRPAKVEETEEEMPW